MSIIKFNEKGTLAATLASNRLRLYAVPSCVSKADVEARVNAFCFANDTLIYGNDDGLYSVPVGKQVKQLLELKKSIISVCAIGNIVYALTSDSVIEFDIEQSKITRQKNTDQAYNIIAVNNSDDKLVLGGPNVITLNSETLDVAETLNDHAVGVDNLLPIIKSRCVTSTKGERSIYVWGKKMWLGCEDSVVSFDCNDDLLATVLENGKLCVHKYPLKKKMKANLTLSIKGSKIFGAKCLDGEKVMIMYGSTVNSPIVEIIDLDFTQSTIDLDREVKKVKSRKVEGDKVVVEYGESSAVVSNVVGTRMRLYSESNDLTMEEKVKALKEMDIEEENEKSKKKITVPKPDSLQHMLVQALHSEDSKLLEDCLCFSDFKLITNTLRQLPCQYVLPLLKYLVSKMQRTPNRVGTLSKWVKILIVLHMAYLSTTPDAAKELILLSQIIEGRLGVFDKLCRLKGKLDVLDQQVKLRRTKCLNEQQQDEGVLQTPLVVFREDDLSGEEDEDNGDDYESEDDDESMGVMEAVSGDEAISMAF
ncbi:hypothetical protein MP638_000471 [Amoeboaphelidium occidentale]|nr:hypothetical protein MP638_000471 [Amoeboaphelidium occidentale]